MAYRERHDLPWSDPRLQAMDLQYHDARPEKSLFNWLNMERITTDAEVARATTEPPLTTRAYLRQMPAEVGVRHRGRQLGLDGVRRRLRPLRRVPMMKPLRWHRCSTSEPCSTNATRPPSCSIVSARAERRQTFAPRARSGDRCILPR